MRHPYSKKQLSLTQESGQEFSQLSTLVKKAYTGLQSKNTDIEIGFKIQAEDLSSKPESSFWRIVLAAVKAQAVTTYWRYSIIAHWKGSIMGNYTFFGYSTGAGDFRCFALLNGVQVGPFNSVAELQQELRLNHKYLW